MGKPKKWRVVVEIFFGGSQMDIIVEANTMKKAIERATAQAKMRGCNFPKVIRCEELT